MYVSNLHITLLLHKPFPSLHPYPKCSLTTTLLIVYFYLQNQTNLSPQSFGPIGCLHFFYFETVYFQALATFTISLLGYLLSVFWSSSSNVRFRPFLPSMSLSFGASNFILDRSLFKPFSLTLVDRPF